MREPIRRALPTVIGIHESANVQVLREPSIGKVIPDLLIGIGCRSAEEIETHAHNSTRTDAHVMTLLENHKCLTAVEIAEMIFMSHSAVDHTLRRLLRAGVVRRSRSGTWRLSNEHRALRPEIVAVELKLSRWREALSQAVEYLEFANWSYVVLDGNRVRETADLRSAFVSLGVGLFFQYGFSTIAVVPPRHHRPRPSVSRVLATSKLFGEFATNCRRLVWEPANDQSAFSISETN
jgi:predicted transcriptional regulator